MLTEDLGQPGDEHFVGGTFGVCTEKAVPENGIPHLPGILNDGTDGPLHAFGAALTQGAGHGGI